eukprot:TRINITY_DN18468_c0_g1_i1.p1 TRINITY_DN18468_c0_g1~~TRINITY_DN18468_c0_g1_i1.p1  ORF type:complete len:1085 (+),score=233.95 TRINITY_DN18468_c0_g1_i1:127-3381(+)
MNPSTSNTSASFDADFFAKAWSFLVAARLELALFCVALVAHFLLFGNYSPRKAKPKSKRVPTSAALPNSFSNKQEVQDALEDAARAGQHKQVLHCWSALKKFSVNCSVPLAAVVEAMLRVKKDRDFIIRELRDFFTNNKSPTNIDMINDLLEFFAKRYDQELNELILGLVSTLGETLNQRSYEILLNMYFTSRNFDEVRRVLERSKKAGVPLTTRASLVVIKTALRTNNFEAALEHFRALKSLWNGPAMQGPSMAPRHIVAQLVDMACKEHELQRFLPELASVPLSEDAVHSMVSEAVRAQDTKLLKEVHALAVSKDIIFSESTYGLLIKGFKGDDALVEKIFNEAMEKHPAAGSEICLALLASCAQTHNFDLAEKAYKCFQGKMPLAMLSAFIRFHFEVENYERVCDLYERDAAPLREKAASEGRSVLDARLERSVMNAALKCGRSTLAQALLTDNPSDIAKHITMIRNCAAEQNLPAALEVFVSLKQSGVELNSVVYNTMLDACVECNQLEKATSWMEQMKKDGMTDVVSYNTLIKAHLLANGFQKARSLVEEMVAAGFQPNCITYNEIVNATVSSHDRRVRSQVFTVLKEMQAAGVKPNQVTCSILLKSLNSHSLPSEISQTMDLINCMDEQIDEVLLSSVVEACVRIGKPDLLHTKLKQLMTGDTIKVNGSHTFGSLIKAYGHARDVDSVWRCWREMRNRRIKPTSITVGCMIEAVVSNGDPSGAWDLIQEMGDDPQCKGILNAVIYCSVLKGFTREKNYARVWAIYEEMQRRDIDLSIVTYNTLLDCCARCSRMDGIPRIIEDMNKAKIKPNLITYSTMLKGHCQGGNLTAAFETIKEMKEEAGLKPDEIMYNSLLDGCAQSGLVEDGLRVLEEMQAAEVPPSNFTLSVVVKLMSRARRVDQAFKLVTDLSEKYKISPNSHVYANLVQACCFAKQLSRGLRTLEEMVERRVHPDKRTYAMLARCAVQQGQYDKASGLLRGALGMAGALPFLAHNERVATCPDLDGNTVSENISAMSGSVEGNQIAAALIADIKREKPHVWIDSKVQRRVLSGDQDCDWQEQSRPQTKGKGKGKSKGYRS